MHAVAIGLALAIGWYWGVRLPRWIRWAAVVLGIAFLANEASAQIMLSGGTARIDSLMAYVDTTNVPKIRRDAPWLWIAKPTNNVGRIYYDLAWCEGLDPVPGLFESLQWVLVNAHSFGLRGDIRAVSLKDSRITFISYWVAGDDNVVRHELLHHLLWANGIGGQITSAMHPMPYFNRCGVTEFYIPPR